MFKHRVRKHLKKCTERTDLTALVVEFLFVYNAFMATRLLATSSDTHIFIAGFLVWFASNPGLGVVKFAL